MKTASLAVVAAVAATALVAGAAVVPPSVAPPLPSVESSPSVALPPAEPAGNAHPHAAHQTLAEEEEAVVAVVQRLFDAMNANDGEMAASVFHPEARLGRANDDGIGFSSADGIVAAIGRAKEQVWEEPIWDWAVHVDGRLAQMWTKYAFYLDGEFSHCGTDAFELYKTPDAGWQVTQLVDTSRTEDCWYPPGREPGDAPGEAGPSEDGRDLGA